jgi:hypothetical protein
MIDGMPVLDAVIHAYNFNPANYANRFAAPIADLTLLGIAAAVAQHRERPLPDPQAIDRIAGLSIRRTMSGSCRRL